MNNNLKDEIEKMLFSLGLMPNYRGYLFTLYSILHAIEHPDSLTAVTKCMYPEIAKMFNTNWESVERNIRSAISQIWLHNKEKLIELSGNTLSDKPKPAQFIAMMAYYCTRQG